MNTHHPGMPQAGTCAGIGLRQPHYREVLERTRKAEDQRTGDDQHRREQDHEHPWQARSHGEF